MDVTFVKRTTVITEKGLRIKVSLEVGYCNNRHNNTIKFNNDEDEKLLELKDTRLLFFILIFLDWALQESGQYQYEDHQELSGIGQK